MSAKYIMDQEHRIMLSQIIAVSSILRDSEFCAGDARKTRNLVIESSQRL